MRRSGKVTSSVFRYWRVTLPRRMTTRRVLAVMDASDVDRERAVQVFELDEPVDRSEPEQARSASTPSEIVTAIHTWKDQHGRLPDEAEWATSGTDHPSARSVVQQFGSWKGGLAAAGSPLEPGHRPSGRAR